MQHNSKAKSIVAELRKNKKLDVALLKEEDFVTEWISTGCLPLDWAFGGGLPVGRVTEIYGDNSTGKSLIAAQVIAQAQADGHIALMCDTESAVSLPIMKAVGVNIGELIYSQPDTVDEVFDIFESAIDSKHKQYPDSVLLLVWDSIAATSVNREMEKGFGDAVMGIHAREISQAMRKTIHRIAKEKICMLFINQTRQKIGVMYGDKETTFGGKAIGFYSSVRLRLRVVNKLKKGKKIVAIETKGTVVKNKVSVPFREVRMPIFFGHGIDDPLATFYWLEDNEFVDKGTNKTLVIGNEELKFTRRGWEKVYNERFDDIADTVMSFDNEDIGAELENAEEKEDAEE